MRNVLKSTKLVFAERAGQVASRIVEDHRVEANSRTIKYIAAKPASNTPLSSETEIRCNRLNSASSGLCSAVACIDPICTRSVAILGLTACCDTTVSRIISTTHNAAGVTRPANVFVLSKRASLVPARQNSERSWRHHKAQKHVAPEPHAQT